MPAKELRGQVAILTGAAQGLGRAIARAYGQRGMKVALIDILADKLEATADEVRSLGGEALALPTDLSVADATQRAVEEAIAKLGAPRVLVHNAALLKQRSMLEISLSQWRLELDIILQAAFILSKGVWPAMIDAGGGSIVYVSSGSGIKGFPAEVAYCPGKHGQEGLMKVLAIEGQPYNIAVNTITPGVAIHTPMSEENYTEEHKRDWVDPALLAPAFVYLAGVGVAEVTGERLNAWELAQRVGSEG
ncbi:MAG: SDR family oxidoreductase [Chloroflexi bacterium]|nr:SDR family oxidoreductase [Chloroflexota bacterium]